MTWFYRFISRFTDANEAAIYRFLNQVTRQVPAVAKAQARFYLQADTARLIMLLEWKFKGYKHLTKRRRRLCYQNLEHLKSDFNAFSSRHSSNNAAQYLEVINQYLHQGRVQYRAGSSFDKLCVDPRKTKLVGDCNQLVALYVYLFALRYKAKQLKLKLLPAHVCLHYRDKDYETTTGQVTVYKKFERLSPISELVAINLLDESDTAAQYKLPPENQLLCAQLASVFTDDKKIAKHNIKVARQALLLQALAVQNWRLAHYYARVLRQKKWKQLVYEHQGFAALKKQSFARARRLFVRAHSARGAQTTDRAELNWLVHKLKRYKTLTALRSRRALLKQVLTLAKRTKQPKIKKWCEGVLRQL